MNSFFLKIQLIFVFLLLLTSCQSTSNKNDLDKNKIYPLKVLYSDSDSFYSTYGWKIAEEFPNIQLEIIPLEKIYNSGIPPHEALMKLMEKEQPDLMFLSERHYKASVEKSMLLPLESLVSETTLSNVHPGAIELIKYYGEGEMYGIPTQMVADTLFYNKTLFKKYNVQLIEGQINWQQFIHTARFFGGSDVLGFYSPMNDPANLVTNIGLSDGLSYINPDYTAVTLNTESWANLYEMVRTMYEDKVINYGNDSYDINNNPFMEGNAAITIGDYSMYNQLNLLDLPFEWGVSPLPSNDPDVASIKLEHIIAIHQQSQNKETAALVIKYLLSEPANLYHEMNTGMLSTSLFSAINKDQDHPFHYLYTRSANLGVANYPREELLPEIFITDFFQRYSDLSRDIMYENINIKEALKEIEDFGNVLLSSN